MGRMISPEERPLQGGGPGRAEHLTALKNGGCACKNNEEEQGPREERACFRKNWVVNSVIFTEKIKDGKCPVEFSFARTLVT